MNLEPKTTEKDKHIIQIQENRASAIQVSITISSIYIGIATALLIFILQRSSLMVFAFIAALSCICSIVFYMFAGEFFTLAIWHQHKMSNFAWYGSMCYGIGQTSLFIALSFLIRSLGHKILSIYFLLAVLISWIIYYCIRLLNIKEYENIIGRWLARIFILSLYFVALIVIIIK